MELILSNGDTVFFRAYRACIPTQEWNCLLRVVHIHTTNNLGFETSLNSERCLREVSARGVLSLGFVRLAGFLKSHS